MRRLTSRWTRPIGRPCSIARLVRVVQPLGGLLRQRARDLDRDAQAALAARDDRGEVLAGEVLHRDEVLSFDLAELVGGDDVRVLELRGDARLVQEHLAQLHAVGEVRKDHLQRDDLDEALDAAALGDVEPPHAAFAQQSQKLVTAKGFAALRGIGRRAARVSLLVHAQSASSLSRGRFRGRRSSVANSGDKGVHQRTN